MVLNSGLLVGLLEIVLGSVLGHSQHLIVPRVIALLRRSPKHLILFQSNFDQFALIESEFPIETLNSKLFSARKALEQEREEEKEKNQTSFRSKEGQWGYLIG
jgi:hypothetical protein